MHVTKLQGCIVEQHGNFRDQYSIIKCLGLVLSCQNQSRHNTLVQIFTKLWTYCFTYFQRDFSDFYKSFIHLSFLAEKWSLIQHRCNCIFGTKLFFSGQHYPPYTPSCIQITTLICQQDSRDLEPCHQAECSCSYSSQNTHKKKKLPKALVKSSERSRRARPTSLPP